MAGSVRRQVPPNVIVIVADDMGYGDLGRFNGGRCASPHLDALAAEGVCLTQHYSASPVCSPARAGLLTGRYPHRTGAIDTLHGRGLDRIALSELTVADYFAAAGYATGLVGKWHNGALDPRHHPLARGFQEFVGFRGGYSDYYDYYLDVNGSERRGDGRYLTEVLSEHAIDFVRRHRSEPFFLLLAYNAPHFPMQAPQAIVDRYVEQGETLGTALTYAMIEVMDAGIGALDQTLADLGLAANTIVLFTSDNGPYLGEVAGVSLDRFNYNLRGAKHYVFEGGIRVPAMIRWPERLEGGRSINDMIHFTDWLPTLTGAAGITLRSDPPSDGGDVLPLLAGDRRAVDPVRFWQCNRYAPRIEGNAAMRDGDWKLVRPAIPDLMEVIEPDRRVDRSLNLHLDDRITEIDASPLPEFELRDVPAPLLFNLAEDPFEQRNLAADHPDRVRKMTNELERWFEAVEADRRSVASLV